MISSTNIPSNEKSSDSDFTVSHYRELITLAKQKYVFCKYGQIPWDDKFVLWRHDCDFSLNRAFSLASVESEQGVCATYFLNPHCEFYNLYEKNQHHLVQKIIALGHDIGLHFDAAFYEINNEHMLSDKVREEAAMLEQLFGVKPSAFSFHNPVTSQMNCEAEYYGGVLNCYSHRFKTEVPYCSDSNGYWRFRRLWDVLSDGKDPCLQVLTHPGWWQEIPSSPRQRIFRSVYGRAEAVLRRNDSLLNEYGRINHVGLIDSLHFLQPLHSRVFFLCDYLWNQGHIEALFIELWRLRERQLNQFCKAVFRKDWQVPAAEINAFFENYEFATEGCLLFRAVFGVTWQDAIGMSEVDCDHQIDPLNSLIYGRSSVSRKQVEDGCISLSNTIEALVKWGNTQPMACDGINLLDSIGIPTDKTEKGRLTDKLEQIGDEVLNFQKTRWEKFKNEMQKVDAGKVGC